MPRFTSVLALVAVTLTLASTAMAARPQTVVIDETIPETFISCSGLEPGELLFSLKFAIHIIRTPKQEIQTVASRSTVTWSANGRSLTSEGSAPLMIDYATGQTKVPGLLAAVTIPGHGIVLLDTGLILFEGDVFTSDVVLVRGPHQSFGSEGADLEAFCAYFED